MQGETRILALAVQTNGPVQYPDADWRNVEAWPRMVQLAWVVTDTEGKVWDRQTYLIQPEGFRLTAEAAATLGLSDSVLQSQGVRVAGALDVLRRSLQDVKVVVAYNLLNHLNILRAEAYRQGLELPLQGLQQACIKAQAGGGVALPELFQSYFGQSLQTGGDAMLEAIATAKIYVQQLQTGQAVPLWGTVERIAPIAGAPTGQASPRGSVPPPAFDPRDPMGRRAAQRPAQQQQAAPLPAASDFTPKGFVLENPFSNEKANEVAYAGFWKRVGAIMIDGILLAVVLGIFGAMFGLQAEGAFVLVGSWLYFTLMESNPMQGTLGKRAIGIKVTTLDGERISFGQANGRYFSKILSYVILLMGFFMAGFTEKKQALHDIIAGTLVVDRN